jgi:hypothetical protein
MDQSPDPTPAEIKLRAFILRQSWDESTREKRRGDVQQQWKAPLVRYDDIVDILKEQEE